MSFSLQGRRCTGAEVVNFSASGIGAWLDERYAALFEPGARLREVVFHEEGLHPPAPDIRIVFSTLAGQSARPGFMMFGGEFISPGPEFLDSLASFLAALPRE